MNVVEEVAPTAVAGVGSTGDPPVPYGHWPDGMGRMPAIAMDGIAKQVLIGVRGRVPRRIS